MVKTIKMAGASALVLASVGSFVLAAPSTIYASEGCNQNPTMQDFNAAYYDDSNTKAHVEYIGEMPMCEGATLSFSLNAYTNEGSYWEVSGNQTLVDHKTVVMNGENTKADLEVTVPDGDCFFQTDLYQGTTRFDGVDGALPHYPDTETPQEYIDSRTGGSTVCGGQGGGEPTPTPEVLSTEILPVTGGGFGDLSGIVALGAGMTGGAAAYLRVRRAR